MRHSPQSFEILLQLTKEVRGPRYQIGSSSCKIISFHSTFSHLQSLNFNIYMTIHIFSLKSLRVKQSQLKMIYKINTVVIIKKEISHAKCPHNI